MTTLPTTTPDRTTRESSSPRCEPSFVEWIRELTDLREDMLRHESAGLARAGSLHPAHRLGASNLLHYLALRSRDVRPLQERLMALGLSSLGRSEAHALATLDAVLGVLKRLAGEAPAASDAESSGPNFEDGARLLEAHAEALLGPPRPNRGVRILVTMPSSAAEDTSLARTLLESGMDCARINCAHDDAASWKRTIENLRHAERLTGRRCRVLMDLAGPKLRTGPIEPGPSVIKIRPDRDPLGRVVRKARVWLTDAANPAAAPGACDAVLPVESAELAELGENEVIELVDARGSSRRLEVVRALKGGVWADVAATTYVVPGTTLRRIEGKERRDFGRVATLPAREGFLVLARGDTLLLTRSQEPGRGAERDAIGRILAAARVGCTLPEALDRVRVGEPVWLDDGRIGCRVRAVAADHVALEVTHARDAGEKLRGDKGINLPQTDLGLPALTEKDHQDLEFVAAHADAVSLSFVHEPEDVVELQSRLRELGHEDLGIVLKIETRRAFERLPQLLLAAMGSRACGVMIARGDLAVECGFERLAEVQEEILWLCEAAHVPVIWATQVLESLAQDGRPSRAEITDAAMAERAECVMLNKGPHIATALQVLDDILERMEGHQRKKSALLRPLQLASHILDGQGT
ncbi:MAG: pyruvate kinase [Planctomycetota bacterium]|nr:pyruvate kinase [Planctomycetota bacterium]